MWDGRSLTTSFHSTILPSVSRPLLKFRRPWWLPRRRVAWSSLARPAVAPPSADAIALSIIVICYKMEGQVGNTLRSLCVPYQREVSAGDYEILVVDNGSPAPLPESAWKLADNIQYEYIAPGKAVGNPGVALNRAVDRARGKVVCLMIDGARMVTPGVLHWGLRLGSAGPNTLVEVRGWHLGHKVQMESVLEGYDSQVERELLASIEWPANGYRLFDISVPAQSSNTGFHGKSTETTCAFMSRSMYQRLGGFDERYSQPGGGLANFDFFWRATSAADTVFTMLGEGTFHQIHGGAATGLAPEDRRAKFRLWREEYERLSRHFENRPPPYDPVLAGHVPPECRRWLWMGDAEAAESAERAKA
jgi:glycosyltransferase involved in cell wall biosynthesis